VVAAVGALALVAAGCQSKHRPTPASGKPAASVVVTRDFGARRIASGRVAPGQTAMTALGGIARVGTIDGGRYVQSIDGVDGSLSGQRDWFFYVDGIESPVGAVDVTLRAGERVWWDYHSWKDYMSVPAVLGSFPEPFVHGAGDRPPAVTVTGSGVLRRMLAAAGARMVPAGTAGAWQVLVGSDAALRAAPAYRALAAQGRDAGLTAFVQGGRIVAYDGSGLRPVGGARAVAWLGLANGRRQAVMAVAGLDAASATRAAEAIARDPALLAGRFAAAFDGDGHVVATAGRP
jgi:hypothetical protein